MAKKRTHASSQEEDPVRPRITADIVIPEDVMLKVSEDGYSVDIYRTDLPPNSRHLNDWTGVGFGDQVIGEGSAHLVFRQLQALMRAPGARYQFVIRRVAEYANGTSTSAPPDLGQIQEHNLGGRSEPEPEPEPDSKKRRLVVADATGNQNHGVEPLGSHHLEMQPNDIGPGMSGNHDNMTADDLDTEDPEETLVVQTEPTTPELENHRRRSLIVILPYTRRSFPSGPSTSAKAGTRQSCIPISSPLSSPNIHIAEFGEAGVSRLTTVTADNILPSRTRRKSRASSGSLDSIVSLARNKTMVPRKSEARQKKPEFNQERSEDTSTQGGEQDPNAMPKATMTDPVTLAGPLMSSDDEEEDIPSGPVSDLRRSNPVPLPKNAQDRVIVTVVEKGNGYKGKSADDNAGLPEGASPNRKIYHLTFSTAFSPQQKTRGRGRLKKRSARGGSMGHNQPLLKNVHFLDTTVDRVLPPPDTLRRIETTYKPLAPGFIISSLTGGPTTPNPIDSKRPQR
ncbi:hypothetical protein QBC43DRAFT_330997 [Cladorrhinum sp. PSN259]|nr:hypothetical protein QBC43DRAFT_330997 [Cladorrhinum sp. PSN259]